MNANISKKEIILGLHQDGKNLDEIQATLVLMFEDDLITSTEVILILLLLEVIFMLNLFLIEH